jgi:hypothetical protein
MKEANRFLGCRAGFQLFVEEEPWDERLSLVSHGEDAVSFAVA